MILTPIQKLANNVGDLGKIIVATSFEWLPKVQKIANSGHTGPMEKIDSIKISRTSLECSDWMKTFE